MGKKVSYWLQIDKKFMSRKFCYPKAFKVAKLERSLSESSLFSMPYIYMSPESMQEMGILWGESIMAQNFSEGSKKEMSVFALKKDNLKKDEVILGEKAHHQLDYQKQNHHVVFLRKHTIEKQNKLSPFCSTFLGVNKPLPLDEKNYEDSMPIIFSKKQTYELLAFSRHGAIKVQIKNLTKKSCFKEPKIFQLTEQSNIPISLVEIFQCLGQEEKYQIIPESGFIVLKGGQFEENFVLQLKEVPHLQNIEVEVIMESILSLKRTVNQNDNSLLIWKSSSQSQLKEEENQVVQELNELANVGAKSTKASSNSKYLNSKKKNLTNRKKQNESSSDCNIPKISIFPNPINSSSKSLDEKMNKIQEQLKNIKGSLEMIHEKCKKNESKIIQVDSQTFEQTKSIVQEDKMIIEEMKRVMQQTKKEFSSKLESNILFWKESVLDLERKISDFGRDLSQNLKISNKFAIKKPKILIPLSPEIQANSPYLKDFKFINKNGKKLIQKHGIKEWTQLLTKIPIKYDQKIISELKILNSFNNYIILGVTDRKNLSKRSSWANEGCIAYMGWKGEIYVNGEKADDNCIEFEVGGGVKMEIELEQGSICWIVGGHRQEKKYEALKNPNIEWVPYFQMFSFGDMVEWN